MECERMWDGYDFFRMIKEKNTAENQEMETELDASENDPPAKKKKVTKETDTISPKKFACTQCYSSFARSDHLRSHEKTHTTTKDFQCPNCDYACKFNFRLKKHIETKHEGKKDLKCPVSECPMKYVTAYHCDLKKHMNTHHKNYKK